VCTESKQRASEPDSEQENKITEEHRAETKTDTEQNNINTRKLFGVAAVSDLALSCLSTQVPEPLHKVLWVTLKEL
jgi:hypothetical protein